MSQSVDIEALLHKTEAFIDTLYVLRDPLGFVPEKQHVATCIGYSDLQQLRDEFMARIVEAIIPFVYSSERQQEIIKQFGDRIDADAAWTRLYRRSRDKFRQSYPKGQFTELLLFVMLQHFFKAAPLLRKMPITTSPGVERHGADAIHVAVESGRYRLYLGEAKTYDRETSALRNALGDAIEGALSHYQQHRKELALYIYEDFIPAELEQVAQAYTSGSLTGIEVHLVCMATYRDNREVSGSSADEMVNCIMDRLQHDTRQLARTSIFDCIPDHLLPRFNYILFPVERLSDLLDAFQKEL